MLSRANDSKQANQRSSPILSNSTSISSSVVSSPRPPSRSSTRPHDSLNHPRISSIPSPSTSPSSSSSSSSSTTSSPLISGSMQLPKIIAYIQSEFKKYDSERKRWEMEKFELKERIAKLEALCSSLESHNLDLRNEVKSLTLSLQKDRSKTNFSMDTHSMMDESSSSFADPVSLTSSSFVLPELDFLAKTRTALNVFLSEVNSITAETTTSFKTQGPTSGPIVNYSVPSSISTSRNDSSMISLETKDPLISPPKKQRPRSFLPSPTVFRHSSDDKGPIKVMIEPNGFHHESSVPNPTSISPSSNTASSTSLNDLSYAVPLRLPSSTTSDQILPFPCTTIDSTTLSNSNSATSNAITTDSSDISNSNSTGSTSSLVSSSLPPSFGLTTVPSITSPSKLEQK